MELRNEQIVRPSDEYRVKKLDGGRSMNERSLYIGQMLKYSYIQSSQRCKENQFRTQL